MIKLLKFLLALAVLAGLGAGFGALFMILGGAILTSAGWAVLGTGSLLNIGLVGGAILFPIPLGMLFLANFSEDEHGKITAVNLWDLSAPIAGLIGAAVLGATAGVQLGYVAAASAIGITVGLPGLVIGVGVIALLAVRLYELSGSGRSSNVYIADGFPEPRLPSRIPAPISSDKDNDHTMDPNTASVQSNPQTATPGGHTSIESSGGLIRPLDAYIGGLFDEVGQAHRNMGFNSGFGGVHFMWEENQNARHNYNYPGSDHVVKIEEIIDPTQPNRITHG